jgi:hypothetical protein
MKHSGYVQFQSITGKRLRIVEGRWSPITLDSEFTEHSPKKYHNANVPGYYKNRHFQRLIETELLPIQPKCLTWDFSIYTYL